MKPETTIVAFSLTRGGPFGHYGELRFLGTETIAYYIRTGNFTLAHENLDEFKDRYGFDSADHQDCIVDLASEEKYDELEWRFGITKEQLGEQRYYTSSGTDVGLTEKECIRGIGTIDTNGGYDVIYTLLLSDCDVRELQAIDLATDVSSAEIRSYVMARKLELTDTGIW
jgi:hypothetical protein